MDQIELNLKPNSVNFLTAIMPTLEGLFLATVLDGKQGKVKLTFDKTQRTEICAMLESLAGLFPDEPGWRT